MGKKPVSKPVKPSATPHAKSGKTNVWLIVGGAAIMLCIVWATLRMANHNAPEQSANVERPPATLIATLSPEDFSGKAKLAYQAAKEIPEILVELPCFCGCIGSLGHRNNLYCFSDNHGSICDECQNIALTAQEMHRKGVSVEKIRDAIRATYGTTP